MSSITNSERSRAPALERRPTAAIRVRIAPAHHRVDVRAGSRSSVATVGNSARTWTVPLATARCRFDGAARRPRVPRAAARRPAAGRNQSRPAPVGKGIAMNRTQGPVLEAKAISKHFEGVFALSDVDLQVRPGEIHALLGENGAGKSTLVKILTGLIAPDSGQVMLDGAPAHFKNVSEAHRAGIVALYQELSIVPNITVAENILLGNEAPSRGGVVDWVRLRRVARGQLKRLEQEHIRVNKMAGGLAPVQQTMVAIARAIAVKARVLIMDEPTAALTDLEIKSLFNILRKPRDEGVAIIYVSHRLEEVFALCDRATIMRNGQVITTSKVEDITIDEVISTMVGRSLQKQFPDRGRHGDKIVVELKNLFGRRVHDVSLTVREGEVLGIGGLAGSGRSELLRIIAGAQRHTSGRVLLHGRSHSHKSVGA